MLFCNLLVLVGELEKFLLEDITFKIVEHVLSKGFDCHTVNHHYAHDSELKLSFEFVREV